jgi:hypothetical protein
VVRVSKEKQDERRRDINNQDESIPLTLRRLFPAFLGHGPPGLFPVCQGTPVFRAREVSRLASPGYPAVHRLSSEAAVLRSVLRIVAHVALPFPYPAPAPAPAQLSPALCDPSLGVPSTPVPFLSRDQVAYPQQTQIHALGADPYHPSLSHETVDPDLFLLKATSAAHNIHLFPPGNRDLYQSPCRGRGIAAQTHPAHGLYFLASCCNPDNPCPCCDHVLHATSRPNHFGASLCSDHPPERIR